MTNTMYFSHVYRDDESLSSQSAEISQQLSTTEGVKQASSSLCSRIGNKISAWIFPQSEDQGQTTTPLSYPGIPVVISPWISEKPKAGGHLLPSVENLIISGEAFPGQELQACGYTINGTTRCMFEWVRYFEDGSVHYIDGETRPNYLITADDIDVCLAIKVQPLDDLNRKGEWLQVYANGHSKITCDAEMHDQIEKSFYSGLASYKVVVATKYLDIWEPAILTVERGGYSIKFTGPSTIVFRENFLQKTAVKIPNGHGTTFEIVGSTEHLLRVENSCIRDTIVLTMRLFIKKDLTNQQLMSRKRPRLDGGFEDYRQ